MSGYILVDERDVHAVFEQMECHLSEKQYQQLSLLKNALLNDGNFSAHPGLLGYAIQQCINNRKHWQKKEVRLIITANMSAGKSTLINALIGKVVSGMKGEAFTAGGHYVFDKPFEDHRSSEWDGVLTMDANEQTLVEYDSRNSSERIYVSTFFQTFIPNNGFRFCFIDTPGVNSSIHREHGKVTKRMLREECYDKLIYVFNANKLGTDEEFHYLKFVAENVPHEKIVFVVNKLDEFNHSDDSVNESVANIKKDLASLGFADVSVYPISAYFSLLIKKRRAGIPLTEDEQDLYELLSRKFNNSKFDLSKFYPVSEEIHMDAIDAFAVLAEKCGLYGLERILYGGEMK